MARKDALLRLHKTLVARKSALRTLLAGELANLRDFQGTGAVGDSADAALEADSGEMSSQLAELDARELEQVEQALARLKLGTFGICNGGSESCQKKIPLGRLNAVPYSTFCINCQREIDKNPDWHRQRDSGNWNQVRDAEAPPQDRRASILEMERDTSSNWGS
jgi:DnaK suppressor protein